MYVLFYHSSIILRGDNNYLRKFQQLSYDELAVLATYIEESDSLKSYGTLEKVRSDLEKELKEELEIRG
jgi:hypothetical protein